MSGSELLDKTHDPNLKSWVASANGHPEFPIQNLPFGIFSKGPSDERRGGVAIGNEIFDLRAALEAGLFSGLAKQAAEAACGSTLNPLMALRRMARVALRQQLSALLSAGNQAEKLAPKLLRKSADCTLHLPASIGDYTDFFAGIHHATNTGLLFRSENPLSQNYKHMPIAYHGRASSIVASDTDISRPSGQTRSNTGASFGASRKLDYELELGIWIGPGNKLGEPISIDNALDHVFGFCLLNDWSARDLQRWEAQPLGPFLGKSFGTTVSPWIVTLEALAPFRQAQPPRPEGDPQPLPYMWDERDQKSGAFDIEMDVQLTPKGGKPSRTAISNASWLYWTVAQMVAHHSVGGCNLQPGDLFGSGTLSGPTRDACGSLLELSYDGKQSVKLDSGKERTFLEDGDEVTLRAHCYRTGIISIGFGNCRGKIVPSEVRGGIQK